MSMLSWKRNRERLFQKIKLALSDVWKNFDFICLPFQFWINSLYLIFAFPCSEKANSARETKSSYV